MIVYTLHREQFLPISISKAWEFFSSPQNLSKITPSKMKFIIVSKSNEAIKEGALIEYRVSPLFSIPLKWVTIISKVDFPYCFVDKQKKGPYSLWEHEHTFKEVPGGVLMTDNVNYALPFGFLGVIAHKLIVKRQLQEIFDYRKIVLEDLFKK